MSLKERIRLFLYGPEVVVIESPDRPGKMWAAFWGAIGSGSPADQKRTALMHARFWPYATWDHSKVQEYLCSLNETIRERRAMIAECRQMIQKCERDLVMLGKAIPKGKAKGGEKP